MGALAPITPWIPEDDLLLKNAVEAGASLESLAKGAVRFSRRFTIQELQERWHSLLYNPVISEEASSRMAELLKSAPNLSLKSHRFGDSRGNEWVPVKRKEESVRSHYYAMRKRICTEPCSSIDLSFLVAPGLHKCTGSGGGCQEQLTLFNEHQDGNCMIGDPVADDFELQDSDYDIVRHAFPQIASAETAAGNICGTSHEFHYGHMGSFEGALPDDCLYGFAENVSPFSVNDAVGNDIGHSFEQANVHKDIPHILENRLSVFDNNPSVREIGPPQVLPVSAFDSIANNQETVCSGFGGRQDFNTPGLEDCRAPFHQLGFSSPLPAMSDIATPAIPIDDNLADKDNSVGDTLTIPPQGNDGVAKKVSPSGYNVFLSGTQLREGVCPDELGSSTTMSEGDFVDLSNSPLNFTHEEVLLFMNDDGKDMIDRSCLDGLNSVLLGSPNDAHRNDISGTTDPETSVALDTGLVVTDVVCPVELKVVDDQLHSCQKVSDSEILMPSSTGAPYPDFPERCNGVICCTLNTEDPEIPCNDDLFSPSQVLPPFVCAAMKHGSKGSSVPTSTKDFVEKTNEQGLNLIKEEGETPRILALGKIESQGLPEIYPNPSVNDIAIKSELLESDPRSTVTSGDPSQCRSGSAAQHSIAAGELNKEPTPVELGKHSDFHNSLDCYMERPSHVSHHMNQSEVKFDGRKQEGDVPVAIHNPGEPSAMEMDFPGPMKKSSLSDQEEQLSENDDDLPYFSDVEAMILDMDLGPCDDELYLSKEVSRYRFEDTKRAIIRLEQGVNSYMQRAITSHKAFAIFYGRHLKHYIKKPEVLLGRATDDVIVDIDLGREGRANKISRRQAIIKMEEDGSFYLKNLSKCSLLVNSKEVSGGHRLKLTSGCLIEIRGMRFLFEVNQNSVMQYLSKNVKKN